MSEEANKKARARALLQIAVRNGEIIRPEKCQACGNAAPLQAHHTDYSLPYEVIWLCRPCHNKQHPNRITVGKPKKTKKKRIQITINADLLAAAMVLAPKVHCDSISELVEHLLRKVVLSHGEEKNQ
jgi:hypothetical protein